MKARLVTFLSLIPFVASAIGQPACKCTYGQSCWPNDLEFGKLASRLSIPLIRPTPYASPCYTSSNSTFDNCEAVTAYTRHALYRSNVPGAVQNTNWANYRFKNGTIEACYLDSSLGVPCGQGNVPPIGVSALNVKDVQEAVKFAGKHHLRLVIKNTGHDYLGRSAGRGAFMIWTHYLQDLRYDPFFRPAGAPESEMYESLTLGAGLTWQAAYTAARASNRFILGGLSPDSSVGAAGGWIQGGGHSAFSPKYGLGVDNVLQFSIVTASGDHLSVNSRSHPDLFWALRGGGGGTWGVLTSVTYRLHPIVPIALTGFAVPFSTPEAAKFAVTEYLRYSPKFADAGWGGYGQVSGDQGLQIYFAAPNTTSAEAFALLSPLVERIPGSFPVAVDFPNFSEWYRAFYANASSLVGANVELASRFVHRDSLEKNAEQVAEAVLSVPGGLSFNQVGGGVVSKVDPENAGLTPAWRTAISHFYSAAIWPDGASASQIQALREVGLNGIKKFEALKPGAGTYLNEASLYEKDFRTTFFGSHYNRLRKIKRQYDRDSLFLVARGVGSEEWDTDLVCRR